METIAFSNTLTEVKACVRSGFCCESSPCPYGDWDSINHRCTHLLYDKDKRTSCARYDEIMKNPDFQKWSPAFGYGCCSSLNSNRPQIIKEFHDGIIPMIEIEM